MSTLSIPTQRPEAAADTDVDARFDSLVRIAVDTPCSDTDRAGVDFETVFDLDYGDTQLARVAVLPVRPAPATARRIRTAKVKTRPVAKRVRLTRRGRAVIVLAFVSAALVAMTLMGGWATASLTGGTPEPVRVIEVHPGDTLYGIASDLAEPGEIRTMVHRIQELNSLPGGQIIEGQKLAVPRG